MNKVEENISLKYHFITPEKLSCKTLFSYFCFKFLEKMKKVFAIALLGTLFVASCSKKADKTLQDSNIMLEEPAATPVVTETETPAPVATPAPVVTDSTATK